MSTQSAEASGHSGASASGVDTDSRSLSLSREFIVESGSEGSAGSNSSNRPELTPELPAASIRGCTRLCVWGLAPKTVKEVWDILNRVLPSNLCEGIRRVHGVRQRNGIDRHDVYAHVDCATQLAAQMVASRDRMGWSVRVKKHVPWAQRPAHASNAPQQASSTCSHTYTTLVTLNVRHLTKKRMEVEEYLHDRKATVVALQETWRDEKSWRLRLRGYNAVERVRTVPGSTGIALLAAEGVQLVEVGSKQSPFFVFARVSGDPLPNAVIYGSVYIPSHARNGRAQALSDLKAELQNMRRRFATTPIVAMGDFNMSPAQVMTWVRKAEIGFAVKAGAGSMVSMPDARGRKGRAIDHFLVSVDHLHCLYSCGVDRTVGISDHWPVSTTMNSDALRALGADTLSHEADSEESWRFVRPDRWSETYEAVVKASTGSDPEERLTLAKFISHHNVFQALALDSGELSLDSQESVPLSVNEQDMPAHSSTNTLVQQWVEASYTAAEDAGLRKKVTKARMLGHSNIHPRKKVVAAIAEARSAYGALRKAVSTNLPKNVVEMRARQFTELRSASRSVQRREARNSWHSFVARSSREVMDKPKRMWAWAKRVSGLDPGKGASRWRPLWDPADRDRLVVDPAGITTIVSNHYATLAADTNPLSPDHWTGVAGRAATAALPGLLTALQWADCVKAIRALKAGRAPGADQLSPEWYKLVLSANESMEGGRVNDHPETPMGTALHRILLRVWESQDIPADWLASILVPIDKKGDVFEVSNLRGISLMDMALKILCVVATQNLQQVFEENHVLRREQAGFRPREECLGQVAALWEILSRRRAEEGCTFASFIDFKTAFDTVPHEALFARLRRVGVHGPVYDFIVALYRGSTMRVRLPDGSLSDTINLGRGVRQGCPLSPTLFDLFIDTLFDEWVDDNGQQLGVLVPGVPKDAEGGNVCPGTLFADDATCLSSSAENAGTAHARLSAWATKWHMQINAGKCGCMIVVPPGGDRSYKAGVKAFKEHPQWLHVQGTEMPIVKRYTYLGVVITDTLDLKEIVKDRADKGTRALALLSPFLRNHTIPLFVRATVFRATVAPVLLYGGELWGGSEFRCKPIQTVMNRGLRLMVGCAANSTMPAMAAVYRELKCPPVASQALARKCRAFNKYVTLSTWIATLITHRCLKGKGRAGSWVCDAAAAVTKHKAVPEVNEPLARVVDRIRDAAWAKLELGTPSKPLAKSARSYVSGDMAETRLCRKKFRWLPPYGQELAYLIRARIGAFVTGSRERHFRKALEADAPTPNVCEFCHSDSPESLPHLVIKCTRWFTSRQQLLGPMIREGGELLREAGQSISAQNLTSLLLGGAVAGSRLSGWDYATEEKSDDAHSCVSDDLSSVSTVSSTGGSPSLPTLKRGCYQMAEFLRRVGASRFAKRPKT